MLSDIFTIADEAFALVLIYNEHHVWVNQQRRKGDATIPRQKKYSAIQTVEAEMDGWRKVASCSVTCATKLARCENTQKQEGNWKK